MNDARKVRNLACVLIAVFVWLTGALALVAQEDQMEFTTNSGGPNITKTTDSVDITLEGTVLTIIGHIPSGQSNPPYQVLRLRIRGYDGGRPLPATYQLGSGDAVWQNLAGTTGLCNCEFGAITINTVAGDGRMTATFSFNCKTLFPSGNEITTQVFNGSVSGVIPIQLKLRIKPGQKFTAKPEDDVTLSVTVLNALNDKPVDNATVYLVDNPIVKESGKSLGTTTATGEYKYTFKVPKEQSERKTYDVVLSAKKNKAKDAPNVTQQIEVEPSRRYWYYRCAGIPIIEYDAGEGEIWEQDEPNSSILKSSGGKVTINRMLTLQGTSFKIDTAPGKERAFYEGKLVCPECPYGFTIDAVPFIMTSAGLNCDGLIKLAASVQPGIDFMGGKVKLTEFGFVGGWEDPSIKITVTAQMDTDYDMSAKCLKSNNPDAISLGIGFVYKKSTGIEQVKLDAENFSVGKLFCFNDIEVTYDYLKQILDAYVRVTFQNYMEKATEVKSKIVVRGETVGDKTNLFLRDFSFQISTDAVCTPVPIQPLFCLKGGRIDAGFDTEKGERKWKFGLTGIFKPTAEAGFKFLTAWSAAAGSTKPEAAEFELGGLWRYPASFSGLTKIKIAKIPYISETKSWQVIADGDITLDFTKGITGKVGLNAGHMGMDDFFASLTGVGLNILFNPFDVSVAGQGTIRIPKVGTELNEKGAAKFLRWVNTFNVSDITLGSGKAYLGVNEFDGFKLLVVCDVTTNPIPIIRSYGRMFFEMKLNTVDGLYIDWGDGYQKLSMLRSRPETAGVGGKTGNHIQAAPLDTFVVSSDVERVFILISGATTAPASELISPSGTVYSETTPDSTVMKFDAANNSMTQWVVVNPEVGEWKLRLTNPAPDDEVSISALRKQRNFSIDASAAGRTLTVTWDGSGLDSADRVSIILDTDDEGFDGIPIGTALAVAGTYTYELTDSLPNCSYFVGATLAAKGMDIITSYAPSEVSTGKTILPPPTNVQAARNTSNGITTISWTPSPDPAVATYMVMLNTSQGDTILAYAERWETSVSIDVGDVTDKRIRVISVGEGELQGCPSEYVSVAVSVNEDEVAIAGSARNLIIVPNPSSGVATAYFEGQAGPVLITIVNALGEQLYHAKHVVFGTDRSAIPLDCAALGNGLYYVHAYQQNVSEVAPLIIRR